MAVIPRRDTTVVSTKGQVTLPKAIRDRRHWSAGMRLTVEETAEGVLLKSAPLFPPTWVEHVAGSLRCDSPPKSLAEMDAAITAEAKRRAGD